MDDDQDVTIQVSGHYAHTNDGIGLSQGVDSNTCTSEQCNRVGDNSNCSEDEGGIQSEDEDENGDAVEDED